MNEIRKLKLLHACNEAIEYIETQPDYQTAWQNCQRGDWMLWLLRKKLDLQNESQLRLFTLVKARCAKLVLHLMKDEHSKKAVAVAENFGNGNATRQELDAAAYAAYAAYTNTNTAADAAYAAADAAYTAAYAAANAADYADYGNGVRTTILQQCAEFVRAIFPQAPQL